MIMRRSSHAESAGLPRFPLAIALASGAMLLVSSALGQDQSADITFVVVGHIYPGLDRPEILTAAVEQINELSVDGVFLLGDLVRTGDDAEWLQLLDLLAGLNAPWFATPGNHDLASSSDWDRWPQRSGGALQREVVINDYQFILLNSNIRESGGGMSEGIDQAQRAFLADALNEPDTYRGRFVMLHHVLWLPDSKLTNRRYRDTGWRTRITPMLSGKVNAIFAGDAPSHFLTNVNGLRHFAIGWPRTVRPAIGRLTPHEEVFLSKPFFLLVRITQGVDHVEPIAVRCEADSALFDTSRWERPERTASLRLKLWFREHLELGLSLVAAVFFASGVLVVVSLRRLRKLKG